MSFRRAIALSVLTISGIVAMSGSVHAQTAGGNRVYRQPFPVVAPPAPAQNTNLNPRTVTILKSVNTSYLGSQGSASGQFPQTGQTNPFYQPGQFGPLSPYGSPYGYSQPGYGTNGMVSPYGSFGSFGQNNPFGLGGQLGVGQFGGGGKFGSFGFGGGAFGAIGGGQFGSRYGI